MSKPDAWRSTTAGVDGFTHRPDEFAMVNDRRRAAFPRHVIDDVRYALERIDCTCGVVVTAAEDRTNRDRHQPLVDAWATHRREAGLETRAIA